MGSVLIVHPRDDDTSLADLERLFTGDPDYSVADVVRDNQRAVYVYLARRLDSAEDAADLAGEVFLALWRRSVSMPQDPVEARMWVFGIARNVLANHQRSLTRRRRLSERLIDEVRAVASTHPVSDDVHDALQELSALDREIVRLVHWDGFTLAEVSRILHRKPATIRSRYARARAKLAELLRGGR